MDERIILHCDLNNFFASVESLDRPELKAVPMAVCGSREQRHGIVLAKNDLAKRYGVKTAEAIWQAKQKCPELVTVPPHYEKYARFSHLARDIYSRYTDLVEPFGSDECWLDVTGSTLLFGTGEQMAHSIRQTVKRELGLTISVGVSFNKVFAKLGSDLKKPDAVTVISKADFREKIWSLPAECMIGVGRSAIKVLNSVGIITLGDLAGSSEELLRLLLGKGGQQLWCFANGLDRAPVVSFESLPEAKSYGRGVTCRYDLTQREQVKQVMLAMTEKVAHCLREDRVMAGLVQIWIKDNTLQVFERQQRLYQPTRLVGTLLGTGMSLFDGMYSWEHPVRSVGIRAAELTSEREARQYTLFLEGRRYEKLETLEGTVDAIRCRYGKDAIVRAGVMGERMYGEATPPAFAM